MANMRIIGIYLFACLCFLNFCVGNEIFTPSEEMSGEKCYVSPEQIVLTEKGILLMTDRGVSLIDRLECDENGIYVPSLMTWTKANCHNGHEIKCRRCHGCCHRDCQYACWCR